MTDALGRTKEARALLESRGPVPPGEVLKLSHWIAQMHLWVAEARATKPAETLFRDPEPAYKLEIDDLELHDRMRKGLSMTAGADLLLLCAWCYDHRGAVVWPVASTSQRRGSGSPVAAMCWNLTPFSVSRRIAAVQYPHASRV